MNAITSMKKADRQAKQLFGRFSFDERTELRLGLEIVKYRLSAPGIDAETMRAEYRESVKQRSETVNRLLAHLDCF